MLTDAGKKAAAGTAAAALTLGAALAAAVPAPAAAAGRPGTGSAPGPARLDWKPCPSDDPHHGGRLKGLECASIRVPLDHDRPRGEQITLALSRARHTASRSQGVVLLNRGGPGANGRDLPALFKRSLPGTAAASYDWIGFDPRGVGASEPSLTCDPSYLYPGRARPDTVPADAAEELAWTARAKAFADDCARKHRRLLPHMGTADSARDLDEIRKALGEEKLNYFGYSYGTYLGAVYATAFPGRVRRMVLDSVARPSGVWYENNLDQNIAFEKRIGVYFQWIARHHRTYGLGKTRRAVAAAYAKARSALKAEPVDGRIGPAELDDLFLADGYGDHNWDAHARALAAYVVRRDPGPLRKAWTPPTPKRLNNYTMYTAVECRDAAWPRDWSRWHADAERLYRQGYRFETWSNTWYNAPCAFWAVPGGPRPEVGGSASLPPILLVHATEDAATPYAGALEVHRRFPSSRLLVQAGGGNHGVSLSGDRCVDEAVAAYFDSGEIPENRPGPDARCEAPPPPEPSGTAKPARGERRNAGHLAGHPGTR
ncbi:alpha/beta hydrolase family protein [Actinomadura hallensis]|uniref:Alpha/beta hydrolase family protein n=1 Tax=Actinomadura hallensis TaxID=337895 RepID=A0A543IIQ6_9ACTN|nr:alpha/beta hydrolase [Actinomadura hallensis]TQM70464.1 alpha/beta hydrolase family protein [Actinomadura hallensis]HLV73785.1 alpha/beta hydrolase [Vulgatibacteraceae bacterium]